jgi:hypothetical protein
VLFLLEARPVKAEQILVIEPTFGGRTHARFNASLLAAVALARLKRIIWMKSGTRWSAVGIPPSASGWSSSRSRLPRRGIRVDGQLPRPL